MDPKDNQTCVVIHADEPIAQINPNIYGHFAEHLGSLIYDGLWVGVDDVGSIDPIGSIDWNDHDLLLAAFPGHLYRNTCRIEPPRSRKICLGRD